MYMTPHVQLKLTSTAKIVECWHRVSTWSLACAENAELIFCPYNYLLDPVIRRAVQIDMEDAVIILDEAHNIEDICRQDSLFTMSSHTVEQLHIWHASLPQPCFVC